jgi:hypothetical protein
MKNLTKTFEADSSRLGRLKSSRLGRVSSSRLGGLMAGKPVPFRNDLNFTFEALPHDNRARHSLFGSKHNLSERQSLSAHQAAEPLSSFSGFVFLLETTHRV